MLKGTITNAGVADFGKKLTVPNIDQLPLPLDDFTAMTKRGSVISARCPDANKTLNMRGDLPVQRRRTADRRGEPDTRRARSASAAGLLGSL